MNITIEIGAFVASILFMLSLKWLGSPKTARLANFVSMLAMALAVIPVAVLSFREGADVGKPVATLFGMEVPPPASAPVADLLSRVVNIGGGVAVGALAGLLSAYLVKMTAMPQMVGLYNGFGGAASLLVAAVEFLYKTRLMREGTALGENALGVGDSIPIHLSILIGGVCFTGSTAAFAKLQELIPGRPVQFAGQHALNLLLLVSTLILGTALCFQPAAEWSAWGFLVLVLVSLVLGWLVVIPIGGADMPVVISLMNSYSGMAVTATGFVLENNLLIIVGSLVGASGIILTRIMCKAMNRSLANVMFGGFGSASSAGPTAGASDKGPVKEASVDEAVMMMSNAQSLIVVPGYGMAVAQAQHAVRDVATLLEKKGVRVRYAIHPVAGRMPGHMNVLLAEANVPYDLLFDLDQINDDFAQTDVVLVVGANDVVNPAAKTTPGSPIFGMPVFNCELAKSVIVLKRSMNPGFAGIDNDLFVQPNTMMVFGDAKKTLTAMGGALKES